MVRYLLMAGIAQEKYQVRLQTTGSSGNRGSVDNESESA